LNRQIAQLQTKRLVYLKSNQYPIIDGCENVLPKVHFPMVVSMGKN